MNKILKRMSTECVLFGCIAIKYYVIYAVARQLKCNYVISTDGGWAADGIAKNLNVALMAHRQNTVRCTIESIDKMFRVFDAVR